MRDPLERELDRLQDEHDALDEVLGAQERKAITREMRDMQKEADEEESWREQGEERRWY